MSISKNIKIKKESNIYHKLINIYAVFKITQVSFLRNFGAIFFTLIFPMLLLLIFGAIFKQLNETKYSNTLVSGIMIAAITGNGLNGLSTRLTIWKESTIVKRMGATPLKKSEFLIGSLSFYVVVMIFQFFWIIDLGFAFTKIIGSFNTSHIHAGYIILGIIFCILFAVSMGVFISSLTNDTNTNSLVGIMIFLPSAFLSGQYIPINVIDKSKGLSTVSKLWPQRYMVQFVNYGWGGSYSNHISHNTIITGVLYPLLISVLIIYVTTKLFKWD